MAVFQVAGRRFSLDSRTVERKLEQVQPEPVREHYVVVRSRRYPPKQVLSELTGLDRADFTTHQARRILKRLGFVAARRSAAAPRRAGGGPGGPHGGRQAAALAPFAGKWVALGQPDEVLVAAETAAEIVAWLSRHGKRASGVFRVPRTADEAQGLAPL